MTKNLMIGRTIPSAEAGAITMNPSESRLSQTRVHNYRRIFSITGKSGVDQSLIDLIGSRLPTCTIFHGFSSGWAGGALSKAFSGWQISGFTDAQSGMPFTIRTGVDSAGIGNAVPARPDYNPTGTFKPNYDAAGVMKQDYSGGLRTFYIPVDGTGIVTAPQGPNGILANSMPGGGNLGRNTFRGPGFQNWNFSLLKSIKIRESVQLQFRSDFSNLWNHRNFQNPVAVMSSTSFGQNTATPLTDSRLILFNAKLKF